MDTTSNTAAMMNRELLLFQVKELEQQQFSLRSALVCSFSRLLDLKDLSTGIHSTRLAEWAIRVARKLNVSEDHMYQVEVAALLHDIGKIGVPDAVLNKRGPLTLEERAVINRHSEYSWSILRHLPGLEDASLYTLHHHENVDGTGYPAGLKAPNIPLVSRIVAVIDAYDAMVSDRCYRKGLPHAEAVRRLIESSGTQFDVEVVHTFLPIAEQERASVFAAAGA
jgi:HD-GYP domain-containing protein (c-di-GMP phosphodiesterase class II)